MMTADETLTLLRQIADDVRALRELAEARREPGDTLRHHDRAALARILPVLHGHFQARFRAGRYL